MTDPNTSASVEDVPPVAPEAPESPTPEPQAPAPDPETRPPAEGETNAGVTASQMPDYKGEPLDGERGPGLGCFWIQIGLLTFFLIFTPLTVTWSWPPIVSAGLLIFTLILLLFSGQTIIFLLRLVAADRRTRRAPLDPSAKRTVGQMEDEGAPGTTAKLEADAEPEVKPGTTAEPETNAETTADPETEARTDAKPTDEDRSDG